MSDRADMLQGTLDLLILRTLALGPMHGWGVSQRIQELSRDVLQVNQGSLYPALQRLKRKGLVSAEWRSSAHNRRARYYELTARGRGQLALEERSWARSVDAVNRILQGAW